MYELYSLPTINEHVTRAEFFSYQDMAKCLPIMVDIYGRDLYVKAHGDAAIKTFGRLPKTAMYLRDIFPYVTGA
jgi:hypothetical protein